MNFIIKGFIKKQCWLTVLLGLYLAFFLSPLQAQENGESIIFYGNALVAGKEHIHEKNSSPKIIKKTDKVKKEEPVAVKKEIAKQEPTAVVFPVIPPAPSSSFYFQGGSELAVISPQQKIGENQHAGKSCRDNAYSNPNEYFCLLYYPEQRQKLSIAATQCGTLTSFGAQSPPRG